MLYEFCLKKRNWSSVGQGSCDWQQGALDGGEAKPRKPLMTPSVAACDSQSVEKAPFVTVNQCGQLGHRGAVGRAWQRGGCASSHSLCSLHSPSLALPGISCVNHCVEPRKLSLGTKAQDLGAASPPVLKQPRLSTLGLYKGREVEAQTGRGLAQSTTRMKTRPGWRPASW